jgi:hypothetical protein
MEKKCGMQTKIKIVVRGCFIIANYGKKTILILYRVKDNLIHKNFFLFHCLNFFLCEITLIFFIQ